MPHLPTLRFALRTSPACIPLLFIWSPSANAVLPPHPPRQTSYPPSAHFVFAIISTPSCSWLFFYTSYFLFPLDSLRVLQWNAGGLRVRNIELLHFISSHLVDVCIQEFNFDLSFFFQIPGFSALRSDRTHVRSRHSFFR